MIKHTLRFGFTEVRIVGRLLTIQHDGNSGNTIENVNANLKSMGFPTIEKLKKSFVLNLLGEIGSPDYSYSITFHIDTALEDALPKPIKP